MNNRLLYEKYRPHTFDDVIGQDKAVKTVTRKIWILSFFAYLCLC